MQKQIFACKLNDDFSGFVDTGGTGKRNRSRALVLGNRRIEYTNVANVCILKNRRKVNKLPQNSFASPEKKNAVFQKRKTQK